MKKSRFLIFFSIFFTLFASINFYIFIHGWWVIPAGSTLRTVYLLTFLPVSGAYLLGRFMERIALSWFSNFLIWVGAFWLGAMVYFFLIVYILDCIRLVNWIFSFYPSIIEQNYLQVRWIAGLVLLCLVGLIMVAGYLNASRPQIRVLEIVISKNHHPLKQLNIVMASDIHLGTIICRSKLEKIVTKMNSLDPDLVLLPGDVVDEDLEPVIRQNLGETLRKIKSKLGIFAINGNHEYIGGVEAADRYLTEHGITMLRDKAVTVNESLIIVGREDRSIRWFTGKIRKPLHELMLKADKSLPVILMDHQPYHLEEAELNGVDLQVSGHTHHGQLWPFHLITQRLYEVSWGYKKKGNTHYYVSCGVGTWGPPVRIGNRPEIVNIRLQFE